MDLPRNQTNIISYKENTNPKVIIMEKPPSPLTTYQGEFNLTVADPKPLTLISIKLAT